MKRLHLQRISFIMTAVYLLLALSPLVSLSLRSQPLLQSLSSECSGDCRQCGCSAERSAAHACCCAQKRAAEAKKRQQCELSKTWPTVAPVAVSETGGDCCSKYIQQYAAERAKIVTSLSEESPDSHDMQTVSISTCPCGSGNDLSFPGSERSQHIPFRFSSGVPLEKATPFSFLQPERLASRHGEPPDPPPKLC